MAKWILSLIGASALCMLALALTPEGRAKRAVKLVCGFVLVLTALSGIGKIDFELYSTSLADYRKEAERIVADSSDEQENEERKYIEEACESYILDKANELGIPCDTVYVRAKWSTEGYWYPIRADIAVKGEKCDIQRLSASIEGELGISRDNQTWSFEDEIG